MRHLMPYFSIKYRARTASFATSFSRDLFFVLAVPDEEELLAVVLSTAAAIINN